jgi:clan AA aspartic protease
MGFTYVNVTVRGMKASRDVRMLVDTGFTYIVLDPETIKELGLLETPYAVDLLLADGRKIRAKLFLAEVEVKGRRGSAFVAELNVPTPLLGVHALETLGFKANPMTGELEEIFPEGGYLLQTTNPAKP